MTGRTVIDQLNEMVQRASDEHIEATKKSDTLGMVSEVFRVIQDKASMTTVDFLNEFLTRGVNAVFHDRDFKVYLDVGQRGTRKTATIRIKHDVRGYVIDHPLVGFTGGGPQVVVAFLLQVLVIVNRNQQRIVFVDEFFTQVSAEYRPGLFQLFQMLIADFQFSFLLITHDRSFVDQSDRVYEMNRGSIRKVR